ncbi:DUF1488 family protein [Derxia gummosa]|uniref:DUF1488 family protein n=1 Tax=Derxia gummosa DSM 723 TaxID=1121388 RepID=A0A8B6XBC7_9BURK|nr:DUF1488 family protein [Derxia gummosa]
MERSGPLHEHWLWLRLRDASGKRVTYLIERETLIALEGAEFSDLDQAYERHTDRIETAARQRFDAAGHGDAIVLTLDDLDGIG